MKMLIYNYKIKRFLEIGSFSVTTSGNTPVLKNLIINYFYI